MRSATCATKPSARRRWRNGSGTWWRNTSPTPTPTRCSRRGAPSLEHLVGVGVGDVFLHQVPDPFLHLRRALGFVAQVAERISLDAVMALQAVGEPSPEIG